MKHPLAANTLALLVAFAHASSSIGAPAPAAVAESAQEGRAQQLRIARIAYTLQTANAAICKDIYPQTGLVVRVQAMLRNGETQQVPFAYMVVPGSPAEQAGVVVGDVFTAIGDVPAQDVTNPGSPFRLAWLAAERSGTLALSTRTGDSPSRLVRASSAAGCNALYEFDPKATPNAVTFGNRIIVYRGLAGLVRTDDELAFVMAHELAHALLHHSDSGNEAAIRNRASRFAMEQDADRLGLLLMRNAGFDPRVAGPWQRYFAERSRGRLQKLVGAYGPYMPTKDRVRYLDEHALALLLLTPPISPAAVGLELH